MADNSWSTYSPGDAFNASGGIGGDMRFPVMGTDDRFSPAVPPGIANAPLPPTGRPASVADTVYDNTPIPLARSGWGANANGAQTQQNPFASILGALMALFRGGATPQAQPTGMTGMLQTPMHSSRSVDSLGNPFNRFG
jgi:hypothetical protein